MEINEDYYFVNLKYKTVEHCKITQIFQPHNKQYKIINFQFDDGRNKTVKAQNENNLKHQFYSNCELTALRNMILELNSNKLSIEIEIEKLIKRIKKLL